MTGLGIGAAVILCFLVVALIVEGLALVMVKLWFLVFGRRGNGRHHDS